MFTSVNCEKIMLHKVLPKAPTKHCSFQIIATQALEVQFQETATIEPKLSAQHFMTCNARGEHNFLRLEDWVNRSDDHDAHCSVHSRSCPLTTSRATMATCGFPCAPYSAQRCGRFSQGSLPYCDKRRDRQTQNCKCIGMASAWVSCLPQY